MERRRKKTLFAWVGLGIGGALAITAAILYGVGIAQSSSAYDRYKSATVPEEIEREWSDVETAQKKVVAGHVLIGAAAIGFGFAVYELLTRPAVDRRETRLRLVPRAAGGALRVTF